MVSPDGHCRTFDADAQGTVFGSGVAVVLLKRSEDAVRDGDQIYAVIRGFAANNDGSRQGWLHRAERGGPIASDCDGASCRRGGPGNNRLHRSAWHRERRWAIPSNSRRSRRLWRA